MQRRLWLKSAMLPEATEQKESYDQAERKGLGGTSKNWAEGMKLICNLSHSPDRGKASVPSSSTFGTGPLRHKWERRENPDGEDETMRIPEDAKKMKKGAIDRALAS